MTQRRVSNEVKQEEIMEVLKLLAHPKFTADEHGHILYYVTKSDVEFARGLVKRLEASANQKGEVNG